MTGQSSTQHRHLPRGNLVCICRPPRATCLHLSCIVHTDVVQVVLCIITGKLLKTRHNRFHASRLAKFTPLEHWFIFQTMEHTNIEISGNLSILRRSIFQGVYKTLKVMPFPWLRRSSWRTAWILGRTSF